MNATPEDTASLEAMYARAIVARDLEVQQLVQRNNFFMIFQGVLLAGLVQAAGNGKIIPIVSFLICTAGLAASVFQVGMAAGAKFWQERWEDPVNKAEAELVKIYENMHVRQLVVEAFSAGDEYINATVRGRMKGKLIGRLVAARFSVSRIPIYAGAFFALLWILLLAVQIQVPFGFGIPSWIVGFKSVS